MDLPEKLKTAAIVQLVSGLVNVFMMAGFAFFALSTLGGIVTTICTLGLFPVGWCCGFLGLLLMPVGLVEIVAGVLGLTNNPSAGKVIGMTVYLEMASLLCGGIGSAIAGFVVRGMLSDPEVVAFLESR